MEEAADYVFSALQSPHAGPDRAFEVMLVRGAVVAKRGSFEMLPNAFVRVELVGVRRQVLRHQPRVCSEPVFDKPAAVSADVIPENDDPARNVAQQGRQEAQHLLALDAAAYQMQVQPSTTSDAGNGRELGPTEWMTDDRRLAAPRPGPSGWWNQREAALVHKYQACTPALGVFSPGASVSAPNVGRSPHRVHALGEPVSASSSPKTAVTME